MSIGEKWKCMCTLLLSWQGNYKPGNSKNKPPERCCAATVENATLLIPLPVAGKGTHIKSVRLKA
jgi:hypothetical protein